MSWKTRAWAVSSTSSSAVAVVCVCTERTACVPCSWYSMSLSHAAEYTSTVRKSLCPSSKCVCTAVPLCAPLILSLCSPSPFSSPLLFLSLPLPLSRAPSFHQSAVKLISGQLFFRPMLYSYQMSLPNLPLPSLQDTLGRVCVYVCMHVPVCM